MVRIWVGVIDRGIRVHRTDIARGGAIVAIPRVFAHRVVIPFITERRVTGFGQPNCCELIRVAACNRTVV